MFLSLLCVLDFPASPCLCLIVAKLIASWMLTFFSVLWPPSFGHSLDKFQISDIWFVTPASALPNPLDFGFIFGNLWKLPRINPKLCDITTLAAPLSEWVWTLYFSEKVSGYIFEYYSLPSWTATDPFSYITLPSPTRHTFLNKLCLNKLSIQLSFLILCLVHDRIKWQLLSAVDSNARANTMTNPLTNVECWKQDSCHLNIGFGNLFIYFIFFKPLQ